MTTQSAAVIFCDTYSPTVRQYLTRYELFKLHEPGLTERSFNGTAKVHLNNGGDQELLECGWKAASGLFAIDGISYVTMRPFEVNVHRCTAFDWTDLHGSIMDCLHAAEPTYRVAPVNQQPKPLRRIRWFDTRCGRVRHYGITTRLFTPPHDLATEINWPLMGGRDCSWTPAGERLYEGLSTIDGVKFLNFRPFEVNIHRYVHFRFAEMHNRIIEVMRSAFEPDAAVEVHNRSEWY